MGPDGKIWFGQGTVTNSGVVGEDNRAFGWLERSPQARDVPCADVVLAGVAFGSDGPDGRVETGAFAPYGSAGPKGSVVSGNPWCNGAILRIPAEGGVPEVVAWGLRNPFGLARAPNGGVWVTDSGYDSRGSRPVFGAPDWLYLVREGAWYGWPDFVGDSPIDDPRWAEPGADPVGRVLQDPPGIPPVPDATFPAHASAAGLDFPPAGSAFLDRAYVALFGDMAPGVGKVLHPVGYRVVTVDLATGVVTDFAANRGPRVGPASWAGGGGLERPVAVRFDPQGDALYVVDFGVMTTTEDGPRPLPGTGVLWRIRRDTTMAVQP